MPYLTSLVSRIKSEGPPGPTQWHSGHPRAGRGQSKYSESVAPWKSSSFWAGTHISPWELGNLGQDWIPQSSRAFRALESQGPSSQGQGATLKVQAFCLLPIGAAAWQRGEPVPHSRPGRVSGSPGTQSTSTGGWKKLEAFGWEVATGSSWPQCRALKITQMNWFCIGSGWRGQGGRFGLSPPNHERCDLEREAGAWLSNLPFFGQAPEGRKALEGPHRHAVSTQPLTHPAPGPSAGLWSVCAPEKVAHLEGWLPREGGHRLQGRGCGFRAENEGHWRHPSKHNLAPCSPCGHEGCTPLAPRPRADFLYRSCPKNDSGPWLGHSLQWRVALRCL